MRHLLVQCSIIAIDAALSGYRWWRRYVKDRRRGRDRGMVRGDGAFSFRLGGSPYHQTQIEKIANVRLRRGYGRYCAALLVPAVTEPHDAAKVTATIYGIEIGYLEDENALDFVRALRRSGFADAACEAELVGGWDRERDGRCYVGVRLNVRLPFIIMQAQKYISDQRDLRAKRVLRTQC